MAFEGIIPWMRDYRNRNQMDQFLRQYGGTLQSGDPDAIAKIPVDPRNTYQQKAVSDALTAWQSAGQGGLIRANTGLAQAHTGNVEAQTGETQQRVKDVNAANEWMNKKFNVPNAASFNAMLGDRNATVNEGQLGVSQRNATVNEGSFGLAKTKQEADFAGDRLALLEAGVSPQNLTRPISASGMLHAKQLQEGDKNRENLLRIQQMSGLGHLLGNVNAAPPEMQQNLGPYVQRYQEMLGVPAQQAGPTTNHGAQITNAAKALRQRRVDENVTFGANTPPVNTVASNAFPGAVRPSGRDYSFLEQAVTGANMLGHRMGFMEHPFATEVQRQYPQRGERNASLPTELLFQQPPRVELNAPTNQQPQQVFTPPPITNTPPAFNPASVAIPPAPLVNIPRLTNFNVNTTSPEQAGTSNPTIGEHFQFPLWQRMIQDFLSQKPPTNQTRRIENPRTSTSEVSTSNEWTPPPVTNSSPRFDPAMYNPAPPTNMQFQVPQTTGINQVGQMSGLPTPIPVNIPAMTNQNPQLEMTQRDIFRDVAQRYQQQSPNEQFKQMQNMTPEQQAMLLQMIADLMGGQSQQR